MKNMYGYTIVYNQYSHLSVSGSEKFYHDSNVGPKSLDPIYIVTYYIKWVKTSWTYCICECEFPLHPIVRENIYLFSLAIVNNLYNFLVHNSVE